MKNCAPKIHPSHELKVVGRVLLPFYDIENCLVEHGDGAGNASYAKRLGTKDREDEGGHE